MQTAFCYKCKKVTVMEPVRTEKDSKLTLWACKECGERYIIVVKATEEKDEEEEEEEGMEWMDDEVDEGGVY